MKKIKYFIIPFLLSTIFMFSQKPDMKFTYGVEPLPHLTEIEGEEARTIVQNSIDLLEDFEFELLVSKDEAIFKKVKQLKNDDVAKYYYNLALVYCDGDKIWYNNAKDVTKTIFAENMGNPLLLTLDEKINWELTNNTKKSGEYTLYEAKGFRTKGSRKVELIAWFSNTIPYSFGPLGFSNLPGLIVELQTPNVLFKLKGVEETEVKIKKPSGFPTMAYQDYFEKLDKEMQGIMARGY